MWYCAQDYSDFKSGYQLTIFLMESGEFEEDDNHTSRGLEYRTQEGAWARYENKRDAYNAVLDEQDRQWKVDQDDFERIRAIYLEHSTKCAEAAVGRAKNDYEDAMVLHKESQEAEPRAKQATARDSAPSAPTRKNSAGGRKKSNGDKSSKSGDDKSDEKRKALEKRKAKLAKLKADNEKHQQQQSSTSSSNSANSNDKKKTKKVVVVRKKSSSDKDRKDSV